MFKYFPFAGRVPCNDGCGGTVGAAGWRGRSPQDVAVPLVVEGVSIIASASRVAQKLLCKVVLRRSWVVCQIRLLDSFAQVLRSFPTIFRSIGYSKQKAGVSEGGVHRDFRPPAFVCRRSAFVVPY